MIEDNMKALLLQMFNGWKLHEASWNGESYDRDEIDCMVEACGGDVVRGNLLLLFSHWSNDIQCWAAHYGLELRGCGADITISEEVPPAPSPDHWWHEGKWNAPTALNTEITSGGEVE